MNIKPGDLVYHEIGNFIGEVLAYCFFPTCQTVEDQLIPVLRESENGSSYVYCIPDELKVISEKEKLVFEIKQ